MVERDDLDVSMTATVGIVSVILTIATIYAVQALYFNYANTESVRKVVQVPTADADSRLAEQEAILARYSWVNRAERKVTIPIERAMNLVVEELRAKQSSSATTVSTTTRRK